MDKSEEDFLTDPDEHHDELLDDVDQLSDKETAYNHDVRKQIDERLKKKDLGEEDSDDEYLDHYYDFDD